eukprot:COSAG06_NODE_42305_length_383_cov_0.598592_1_plen_26_part_01
MLFHYYYITIINIYDKFPLLLLYYYY